MNKFFTFIVSLIFLYSCGSKSPKILGTSTNPTEKSSKYQPFNNISEYSNNKKYGLSAKYPVKVGENSAKNQRKYLASLAGPNGEELTFHRRGSCCPYKSENGLFGSAMVDVYEVTYKGLKKPILVYISFYDYEPLFIPEGFTKRKK